jgi:hypothetical protein
MSTARLEKLTVAQQVKKFLAFRLITVFTRAIDCILSQCAPLHPFFRKIHFNIILPK